ncbi:MAG: flagellar basal body-associated FliL family protein [Oceanicoccus sp.]
MAEKNEELVNEDDEIESSGSGKLTLIIMVAAVILAISASIGGTLYLLGFFDSNDVTEGEEQVLEEVDTKPSPAMYFPIKPAFTVNFSSRGRQRYLQVDVSVLTRNVEVFNALQTHLPLVKNRLVMLFGGEIYDELQTDEGKELLRQKALEALQEIIKQEVGVEGVEEVLFTNFVMQ